MLGFSCEGSGAGSFGDLGLGAQRFTDDAVAVFLEITQRRSVDGAAEAAHEVGAGGIVFAAAAKLVERAAIVLDAVADKFVDVAKEIDADLVGMSALLTTTMVAMKSTIELLEAAGLKDRVKTMVGGAPVSQDFADRIGASGYAPDAVTAVDKAKELLGIES